MTPENGEGVPNIPPELQEGESMRDYLASEHEAYVDGFTQQSLASLDHGHEIIQQVTGGPLENLDPATRKEVEDLFASHGERLSGIVSAYEGNMKRLESPLWPLREVGDKALRALRIRK